jgi:hypothetical protein
VSRLLVRAFAGWRTGLSGPVIVLQAGALALIVLVAVPNPRLANAAAPTLGQVFPIGCSRSALPHPDRRNIVLLAIGPALSQSILPPFATAHTPVGPGEIGVLFFLNTFLIVVAQIPATRSSSGCAARTLFCLDQRAMGNRPARGPARNANALDARR